MDGILSSKLVLIAYDCDFNFEPCNKEGRKAHWALVNGYVLRRQSSKDASNECDIDQPKVLFLGEETSQSESSANKEHILQELLYVICKHGKSRHDGMWLLQSLIDSNRQLKLVNEAKCNLLDFVRPIDGNIEQGLASKCIIIKTK